MTVQLPELRSQAWLDWEASEPVPINYLLPGIFASALYWFALVTLAWATMDIDEPHMVYVGQALATPVAWVFIVLTSLQWWASLFLGAFIIWQIREPRS